MNDNWKLQREWKGKPIPSQEEVYRLALTYGLPMDRSLFVLAYLTAGRISELVQHKFLRKNKYQYEEKLGSSGMMRMSVARNENKSPLIESVEKIPLNYPGIKRNNVYFEEKRDKKFLVVELQNRKNKLVKTKRIPVSLEREGSFVDLVRPYLESKAPEEPLFPFGIWKAERIISKVGMNPHFLRDIRLTHLVTIYDFDSFRLVKFAGWTDPRPAKSYVQLSYTDIIDRF